MRHVHEITTIQEIARAIETRPPGTDLALWLLGHWDRWQRWIDHARQDDTTAHAPPSLPHPLTTGRSAPHTQD